MSEPDLADNLSGGKLRVTVPGIRTCGFEGRRTAQARAALVTARLRRAQQRAENPICPRPLEQPRRGEKVCGTRTVQNDVERERAVFWCPGCARYAFGNGFGPDKIPEQHAQGSQQGPLAVTRSPGR